jgi:hypothetical protein
MDWNRLKILIKTHPVQAVAFSALLTLTATQFTNCGGFSAMTDSSSSSFACTSATCITPTLENLSITPILGSSGSYFVSSAMSAFNLAGQCNEGGYPGNVVKWQLMKNGTVVRTSDGPVAQTVNGWGPANGVCVNGHFSLYVNVGPDQNGSNFSASGLGPGFTVNVSIYGLDSGGVQTAPITKNVTLAVQ